MSNTISPKLKERCDSICELCTTQTATVAYTVSPKDDSNIDNQVALCETCVSEINEKNGSQYWSCLAGSIWNEAPAVQALSYRILYPYREEQWAGEIMNSVDLTEAIINWALDAYKTEEIHKDSYGNVLANGDTVVLTQQLNVKGAS